MGIVVGMTLGVASVEASALPTVGMAGLLGQLRPSRVDTILNNGIDAYRRGDYVAAAGFFQQAQKQQDYLSADKRVELKKYVDDNNEAIKAQRAGAEQLKQAEDLLKAGKGQDAETLVKQVVGNQFLTLADKQKAQQLWEKLRPNNTSTATADPNGVPLITIARGRLKQGREHLAHGNFEVAEALANDTLKLKVVYDKDEDRPDKLLIDIRKCRNDEKWLLQTSRECLKRGELDQAEKLAHLAEKQSNMMQRWFGTAEESLGRNQSAGPRWPSRNRRIADRFEKVTR